MFDVLTLACQNSFWNFATFILPFAININYFHPLCNCKYLSRKTNICTLKKAIPNKADIVTDYQNQINQADYIQLENLE